MNLVPRETSLVVAGAWNPAILTPAWVLRHALGKDTAAEQSQQVQVFIPAGLGIVFDFPKFVLQEFSFMVRPDTLVLAPTEQTMDDLGVLEDGVARMLNVLRHTPVSGVGHNFEFRDSNPPPDDVKLFTASRQDLADHMPPEWEPTATAVDSSFKSTAANVIISVQRRFEAGSTTIKFNFHHPVSSAEEALAVLGGVGYERMTQTLGTARNLVTALYGGQG